MSNYSSWRSIHSNQGKDALDFCFEISDCIDEKRIFSELKKKRKTSFYLLYFILKSDNFCDWNLNYRFKNVVRKINVPSFSVEWGD